MRTTSSGIRTIAAPLIENITTMVKSRKVSVSGLILGMKRSRYQVLPFSVVRTFHVTRPATNGNPEVDADALGDLPDRDVHDRAAETEPSRQHGNEHICVNRKEQHLEDRVECDQSRAVVGVAVGQIVPHDHHRDASREADHDQPDHVLGPIAQKDDRQREHQDRADDPVLHQRQRENLHSCEKRRPARRSSPSPAAGTSSG